MTELATVGVAMTGNAPQRDGVYRIWIDHVIKAKKGNTPPHPDESHCEVGPTAIDIDKESLYCTYLWKQY